jgi:flagellar secretion chaperone FliS
MYHKQKAVCGAYQKNELDNLTPVQIVARLYQALELSLKRGREAIIAGDPATKGEQLGRALAIIGELQAALNLEEGGEIGGNLNNLYFYLTAEITKVNLANDVLGLDNAIVTVKPLTEAWVELAAGKVKVASKSPSVGGRSVEAKQQVAFQATF